MTLKAGNGGGTGEILVRLNRDVGRMIDRQQPHVIEVGQFLHHFGESKTEPSIPRLDAAAVDLQILGRIRNVALARRHPMADDAGADHVGNELVSLAVPGKHHRAGAAASIDFVQQMTTARCELHLILHDSRGPQQSHDVRLSQAIDAGQDARRVLSQVAGR